VVVGSDSQRPADPVAEFRLVAEERKEPKMAPHARHRPRELHGVADARLAVLRE
jgi:hypothetical protein